MHTALFTSEDDVSYGPMAAAIFNKHADSALARARSAGFRASGRLNTLVIEVMREMEIDLSGVRPEVITPDDMRTASLMVHLGQGMDVDRDGVTRLIWELPSRQAVSLTELRAVRTELEDQIAELISGRDWGRVREVCPACSLAVEVPADASRVWGQKCPNCDTALLWEPGSFRAIGGIRDRREGLGLRTLTRRRSA
jgi:arsenate reductase